MHQNTHLLLLGSDDKLEKLLQFCVLELTGDLADNA
jgi:hypothetical protein